MKKGIAFPTCLSINNCICHFSPSKNDPDYVLKEDDVVKIDLGAHIDGFIAVVAYTLVVGASLEKKVKGRKADVILAAYNAAQATLRLVKPGKGNYGVTEAVQKVADSFKCKPIEGMLSHQLKQFKIDGEKTIIQNPTAAQKKEHEKVDFEDYEVYAMDVLVSSGEGAGRELDTKVSIYKKTDVNYLLKLKASKAFYGEVRYPQFFRKQYLNVNGRFRCQCPMIKTYALRNLSLRSDAGKFFFANLSLTALRQTELIVELPLEVVSGDSWLAREVDEDLCLTSRKTIDKGCSSE